MTNKNEPPHVEGVYKLKTAMKITLFVLSALITGFYAGKTKSPEKNITPAKVDYEAFEKLVSEVKEHRIKRLVNLDEFLSMSLEKNTIILDTRSDKMFEGKHLKGAKHLSFPDFTQTSLARLIPDKNTRILIYCNNNFEKDKVYFETKSVRPDHSKDLLSSTTGLNQELTLALNIPTYINLFGYGYKNVYELNELVDVDDKRITFEGTSVSH